MFDWLLKKKLSKFDERLAGKKQEMDEIFHFRPWSVFPVDRELLEGMGAFEEDAVSEEDFYEPLEEFLEEIFCRDKGSD
jgi:hypothetical protein